MSLNIMKLLIKLISAVDKQKCLTNCNTGHSVSVYVTTYRTNKLSVDAQDKLVSCTA
jgi:hypothetical protein